MTTHAIIRNSLRTLVASFLATCLLAVWPQSAQAGKSGGGRVQHKEITVTVPRQVLSFFGEKATRWHVQGKSAVHELPNEPNLYRWVLAVVRTSRLPHELRQARLPYAST